MTAAADQPVRQPADESERPNVSGTRARRLAPYLWVFALTLLFFSPRLLQPSRVITGDYFDYNVPNRVYATAALRAGRIPHWISEMQCGFPFLSDPQTAVFFPGNLLLAAATPYPGTSGIYDWYVISFYLVNALGGVFLARSLGIGAWGAVAAGLVMTHNGFMLEHFGHVNIVQTAAVGLWTLGALVRALRTESWRMAVGAGLLLASAILAGHPQLSLFLCYAMFGGAGVRLWQGVARGQGARFARVVCKGAFIALGVGVLGAMIQILPTAELLKHTDRRELSLEAAMQYSLPPSCLPGLLFPKLYSTPLWRAENGGSWGGQVSWAPDGSWEYLGHFGAAALAMALLGWQTNRKNPAVQALFWGAVVAVLCATGPAAKLYPLLYDWAPGFKQLRIPPRLLWLALTAVGLLTGYGVDALLRRTTERPVRRAAAATGALLAALAAGGGAALLWARMSRGSWHDGFVLLLVRTPEALLRRGPAEAFATDILHQLAAAFATLAFLCAVLFRFAAARERSGALAAAGMTVLIFAELALYGVPRNIAVGWEPYDLKDFPPFREMAGRASGRVLVVDGVAKVHPVNGAFVHGLDYAGGYNVLKLRNVAPYLPLERISETPLKRLWNVAHVFQESSSVTLAAKPEVTVADLGWTWLSTGEKDQREVTWAIPAGESLRRIHLLTAGLAVLDRLNGYSIAEVEFLGAEGDVLSTAPVRCGIETAEWSHGAPHAAPALHDKPPVAYSRSVNPAYYAGGAFYMGSLDAPSTAAVREVRVRATAPLPAALCVSHLLLEREDGSVETRAHADSFGYRLQPMRHPDWVEHRSTDGPGYAWMVPQARWVHHSKTSALRKELMAPGFDPAVQALTADRKMDDRPVEEFNAPDVDGFRADVRIVRAAPERYEVVTRSDQRGWLVFNQAWYEGWTARVDGKRARTTRANGGQFAVPLEAGEHRVEMRFETPGFRKGAAVSAVVWLGALGALVLRGRRVR